MAHAHFQFVPVAEAATPASWTDTAAARLAIAACIEAGLEPTEYREVYGRRTDYRYAYEGPLADAVDAAREAWLIEQGEGQGTIRYMRLHFEVPTVEQALNDARMLVERVSVAVQPLDERLNAITTAERDLSAAEWAYLDAVAAAAAERGL